MILCYSRAALHTIPKIESVTKAQLDSVGKIVSAYKAVEQGGCTPFIWAVVADGAIYHIKVKKLLIQIKFFQKYLSKITP